MKDKDITVNVRRLPWPFSQEEVKQAPKKKGGRPKGSKNREKSDASRP